MSRASLAMVRTSWTLFSISVPAQPGKEIAPSAAVHDGHLDERPSHDVAHSGAFWPRSGAGCLAAAAAGSSVTVPGSSF